MEVLMSCTWGLAGYGNPVILEVGGRWRVEDERRWFEVAKR